MNLPRHSSSSLGPLRVAAISAGALAVGAVAIGALAIGYLAIKQLSVSKSRIGTLDIDDLNVRRIRIGKVVEPEAGSLRETLEAPTGAVARQPAVVSPESRQPL